MLPVDEAALNEHLRAIGFRHGRIAVIFLVVFVAVLWPTDWIVFRGMPEVQNSVGALRLSILAVAAASFALLNTAWGVRTPNLILGVGGTIIMFAIGRFLGRLGDPDQPWVHLAYPAIFVSVVAPIRLAPRALLVGALTVALCAGCLWSFPRHFHAPLVGLMLSFVFSMAVMVVAVGSLSFSILRRSFYQSLALERASRELANVNEDLESRVMTQTRDLRRLAEHLECAREEERKRISRELHDELGQQLTALKLALELTQQRLTDDPQRIRANLSDIEALVKRTHATVRHLVTELRPVPLEELGLRAAIEGLAQQTEQRSAVRCQLDIEALDSVPTDLGMVAFRVVQEALTNVLRHARAARVEIIATSRNGELKLSVSDDGVGPPAVLRPSGFGLIGIRERVTTLNGHLEMRPRTGGGTTLAVTLPLRRTLAAS